MREAGNDRRGRWAGRMAGAVLGAVLVTAAPVPQAAGTAERPPSTAEPATGRRPGESTTHVATAAAGPSASPSAPSGPTLRPDAVVERERLLADLMDWAVRLSGLPPAPDRPPVIALTAQALSATVCPDDPRPCGGMVALYDTDRVRVLIRDSLDLDDPTGQSFVVHEFVHHLQHRAQGAALTSRCESVVVAETQAYQVQNRFLARHRQLLRVGDLLRRMQCDSADGDPVVVPYGTPPRPLAGAAPLPGAGR